MQPNLVIFSIVALAACLIYPPMFGLFIGMGIILAITYVLCAILGG